MPVNTKYDTAQLQGIVCLYVTREFLACHSCFTLTLLASYTQVSTLHHMHEKVLILIISMVGSCKFQNAMELI